MGYRFIKHLSIMKFGGKEVYKCNQAFTVHPQKVTRNPDEVECKNCLKILHKKTNLDEIYVACPKCETGYFWKLEHILSEDELVCECGRPYTILPSFWKERCGWTPKE